MSDETNDETAAGAPADEEAVHDKAAHDKAGADKTGTDNASVPRRRRTGLIILAALALAAGVAGSWAYNSGLTTRHEKDTALVRAATDPSTYITPGDYNNVTVPIRNDGPYPVTVVGLYLPTAPSIEWDSAWLRIQPGATGYLRVTAPYKCPAIPHSLKHTGAVPVLLNVYTENGNSHVSLRTSVSGVLQYAADYCAAPPPLKRRA